MFRCVWIREAILSVSVSISFWIFVLVCLMLENKPSIPEAWGTIFRIAAKIILTGLWSTGIGTPYQYARSQFSGCTLLKCMAGKRLDKGQKRDKIIYSTYIEILTEMNTDHCSIPSSLMVWSLAAANPHQIAKLQIVRLIFQIFYRQDMTVFWNTGFTKNQTR